MNTRICHSCMLSSAFQELGEKSHEVILHFPEVKPHHFTNFTLHVTNIVGNSTAQVILLKGNTIICIPSKNLFHNICQVFLIVDDTNK